MGKTKARKYTTNVDVAAVSDNGAPCGSCLQPCFALSSMLCKVCDVKYHPACVNIPDDVFHTLLPILPVVGWVCPECVNMISNKHQTLQTQLESITSVVTKLQQDLIDLEKKVKAPFASPGDEDMSQPASTEKLNEIVQQSLKDSQRRQKNIIISGLPESRDVSDADVLRSICEENLKYKPWFDDTKCKRIGKSSPRRLLVTLPSAQSAADIIYIAKKELRRADPASLASKIYINPDLSPDEALQAYLKRKARRERQLTETSGSPPSPLNPLAPPFRDGPGSTHVSQ